MSNDQQRAEKLECGRDIPAVTKEKEIAPEAPGCDLGRDQQCVVCIDVESVMKHGSKRRIGGEKSNVGNFHQLMIDRRHDRLVAAFILPSTRERGRSTVQLRPQATVTSTRLLGCSRQQVLYKELRSAARIHPTKTCAPSPVSSACSIPCGREKFAGRV